MVTRRADHLFLVVNAACKEADTAHLRAHIGHRCLIEPLPERALLALQGPKAAPHAAPRPGAREAHLHDRRRGDDPRHRLFRHPLRLHRRGRLRDLGRRPRAEALARALLAEPEVAPAGLGARDTLRLEAGLCLYGHDIDTTTTPVQAGLTWAIQKVRRPGGERAGGYPGAEAIAAQLANGAPIKRVGLVGLERVPVREGAIDRRCAGAARPRHQRHGRRRASASRSRWPTRRRRSRCRHVVHADVRGKRQPMRVSPMPFAPHRYFRG